MVTGLCRVIQGLHENLIADLDQGSYHDEIDSASREFEESRYRLLSNIHCDDENEGIKSGGKATEMFTSIVSCQRLFQSGIFKQASQLKGFE